MANSKRRLGLSLEFGDVAAAFDSSFEFKPFVSQDMRDGDDLILGLLSSLKVYESISKI